jgi:aerobic-type carbon monoxide dehydrogenase small subunit (CoxS/CutS family)
MTDAPLEVTVNGRKREIAAVPHAERLLDTLRWRLGLLGTKEGCRTGDCGACTVLLDKKAILSCLVLAHTVRGRQLTTIEGVAEGPIGRSVQEAFLKEEAVQCGYCTPGFVMALCGLLGERRGAASVEELLEDLQSNLCRCTGYRSIVRAVARAQASVP